MWVFIYINVWMYTYIICKAYISCCCKLSSAERRIRACFFLLSSTYEKAEGTQTMSTAEWLEHWPVSCWWASHRVPAKEWDTANRRLLLTSGFFFSFQSCKYHKVFLVGQDKLFEMETVFPKPKTVVIFIFFNFKIPTLHT